MKRPNIMSLRRLLENVRIHYINEQNKPHQKQDYHILSMQYLWRKGIIFMQWTIQIHVWQHMVWLCSCMALKHSESTVSVNIDSTYYVSGSYFSMAWSVNELKISCNIPGAFPTKFIFYISSRNLNLMQLQNRDSLYIINSDTIQEAEHQNPNSAKIKWVSVSPAIMQITYKHADTANLRGAK